MHDYNNRIQDGTIFFIPLVVVSIFVAHIVFVAFVVIAFGLFRRFRFRRGRLPPCCRGSVVLGTIAVVLCFRSFSVFFVFVVAILFRCCRRIVASWSSLSPSMSSSSFSSRFSFLYSMFHILVRPTI